MKKSLVVSGSGGQGVMSAGIMIAQTAVSAGKYATFLPEYGPEQRGGSAKCTVIISDDAIISPLTKKCDNLVALNEQAYNKFADTVKQGGRLIANSSLVTSDVAAEGIKAIAVPVDDIALEVGSIKVANVVIIGVLIGATDIVSKEIFVQSLESKFRDKKPEILEMNMKALEKGIAFGQQMK